MPEVSERYTIYNLRVTSYELRRMINGLKNFALCAFAAKKEKEKEKQIKEI